MANYVLCSALFRIALPIFMSVCIAFRPCGLSALYLLLLFYLPFVPVPTTQSMSGHTGIYLKILIAVSSITTFSQLVFQIVLLSMPPYANFLKNCEFLEKVLRHVGFIQLNDISLVSALTWLSPELLLLLISIIFYIVLKKLVVRRTIETLNEEGATPDVSTKKKTKRKYLGILIAVGRYCVLLALCLAAVLRPSVLGGLYFLIFLSTATWWACCKQLQNGFAILLRCLLPIVFLHLCGLYTYQFQWPQELLEKNSTYARYFGLTPILSVDCNDPRDFIWSIEEWATYVNPIALYLLYYILVLESNGLMNPEESNIEQVEPTETTPLIGGVSPSTRRYGSGKSKRSGILQDSTGSVTVTGENSEDIPMETLGTTEDEYSPTLFENILYALESVVQLIIRSSYVGTNIMMMAWSITYLSWITFVLLIWANLIWLVPNQRKSMLRSSPFLVFYAWFLLISAYIYSMNLTESELPSSVKGINLAQFGFVKVHTLPCNPLLVKCLFTVMFWIALRQYMHEKKEQRQNSAIADMVAPLQVTVGTATGVKNEQEKGSKIMDIIGKHIKQFLTKFWIWVVAVTLFGVAITGQRMTSFRIIYMALFLFFVMSFQLSFRLWRKMMFGFWLTVIVYSMVILVAVYTYQFDNFPEYWRDYLHVPLKQQLDIGLERFETKQLFVRLVTPTFFVIITVIQLHYFHKEFMEMSDPKNTSTVSEEIEASSLQGGAVVERDPEKEDLTTTTSIKFDLSEIGNITSAHIQELVERYLARLHRFMNLFYLFLELHMPKIVLLFAMLLCVYDKCALYLVIIILISLSLVFGRPLHDFAIYFTSMMISILLLARMIYQIQYIKAETWNVTCESTVGNTTENRTINNAEWLGFYKSDDMHSLPTLLKWNIIYILVVTLWAVVQVRQYNYRISRGKPPKRAFFMFPRITRQDADKDLLSCFKYLANYTFYKFGIEFSLMATVALIGFRMDMYAIIYSIWLTILFIANRKLLSRIWNIYLIFIAVLLPVQYFMVIGLPPGLCIEFPWDYSEILRRFQEWAYLLDTEHAPSPKKLICDFILLLFVSRQSLVFRIERRYANENYAGGSNDSIIHLVEEKNFQNPTPDYITYVRSYVDVIKRVVLQGFLWVTLAIVFLAGTNRVNVFSIGYLVGAFVFLWQGSDFYLRPIPKIIKAWNWLLGYNVLVITLKTILQLLGCVFIQEITSECWMVQLFGVGCVRKFGNIPQDVGIIDPDDCKVPREFIGLVWDGLCFGFLIMQRRIFQSFYFFHMIDETKATTILASRGAELIEELRQKRMKEQEEQERQVLEKIKAKMDRIKATQQKIQGATFKGDKSHFTDTIFKNRPRCRRRSPKSYKQAIRSGDYYMFDDLEDDEIDLLPDRVLDEDEEEEKDREARMTVSKIEEHTPKSVTIAEKEEEPEEPQPGTSKDEDFSELTEPKQETTLNKIITYIIFGWTFCESSIISLTRILNQYSKDYRYVIRVLRKEKKILKEKTSYNVGLRMGSGQVWHPAGSYHSLLRHTLASSSSHTNLLEDYEGEMSSYDQPAIIRLILAAWYIVMSRSEMLCYFIVFLNQIKSATFLSLPLPLMVFVWGTLTIPRPSKTFWVTIIAYTQIIVLIKCMFQFDIIPWNRNQAIISDPFYPPRIIGIERKKNYAVWDLLLLLVVFFHRYMLKSMGIWRSTPVMGALLSDGDYKFENGELKPVESGSQKDEQSDMERLVEDEDDKKTSISSDEERIVSLNTQEIDQMDSVPQTIQMATYKYTEALRLFFQQLLDPTSRVAADVYSYMFLCDFFNFFVILIGYSSFGPQQGDGGVSSYLEDNRVPALFLIMLILQFMLIIIDRGIFLRKNILAKIIFQFTQIFLMHLWLFVLFPIMTGSRFNSVLPPQMYYMVKCFYLLLSAYQIRCGYPTRILGNFLCKGYNYVNMFLFKGFMAVPFLFELRTVMDWMWTDTSMTVFDWIKMEDIFAHIFQLKCARHVEDEYPQPRGMKKNPIVKYAMGGGILAIIIAIIWFPLVFFSLGNAVGKANVPYDVTLEIRIGPYEPVYQMSAQSNFIYSFNELNMQNLLKTYSHRKTAVNFISNYEESDIAAIKLSTDSANIWSISPPDRQRMLDEVNSTKAITVRLEYKVSHQTSKPEDSGVIPDHVEIDVPAGTPARKNLLAMLQGDEAEPIELEYILPKFLKVTNRGTAKAITQLMDAYEEHPSSNSLRNISLKLLRPVGVNSSDKEWWQVHESCKDLNYMNFLKRLPYSDCDSLILYTFNDKIFPATLNIITGGGIIGLYTTIVFVASRFLRGFFADQCSKIMFEDMPNVDRVLQLCLDVYLVREAREFALEEDLFAKLVFLFRSPETLIKWTRPKEELEDDEDPEGDN